jgi:hypothetical protein
MDIPKSASMNSDEASFAFLIAQSSPKGAREPAEAQESREGGAPSGFDDGTSGMHDWIDKQQQQALPDNEKFKFETHGGDASLLNLAS